MNDAVAGSTQRDRLHGDMNTLSLILTVLAFNGPLTVVIGFITVVVGFGNGLGAPVAYVAAGVIVGLFSVGYTAMGKSLTNPGAFYAYITAGLGRPAGLGGSYLALMSYFFILAGVTAYFGISLQSVVRDTFNGPEFPWWFYSGVIVAISAVLGYFRIDFSVRVLGVLLALEIILILVFYAAVVLQNGSAGLGVSSFKPTNIFSGNVGLALLFGITCFSGFEATAIFRDEVRDPVRTIPRATYGAVALICLIYTVGAWVVIQAIGADRAVEVTAADPPGAFYDALKTFVGGSAVAIFQMVLCTSILAAGVSTHNVTTRYIFNLGSDGIFPRRLGAVHPRFGSPSTASILTTTVIAAFIASLVFLNADPNTLYAVLVGIGGYALIGMLALTFGTFLLGFCHALMLRMRDSAAYLNIGRQAA